MDNIVDIKKSVPPYLLEFREFQLVYTVLNKELQELQNHTNSMFEQFFIETMSIEGIKRMETICKITPLASDTLEERRFRILLKINKKLPHTYRSLYEWLKQNLGEANFELKVYHETYQLELMIKEYSNKLMRYIIDEIKEMIPVNIVFLPIGSYVDRLEQTISYSSSLELVSSFYPRYNLEPRTLNGSWLLGEDCLLNGYKTDKIIDFYPTNIEIDGSIKNDVLIDSELEISSMAKETIKTTSEFQILSRTENEIQVENNMILQGDSKQKIEYDTNLVIEKDLWHLDGTMCLDGGRLLDAEIQKFVL